MAIMTKIPRTKKIKKDTYEENNDNYSRVFVKKNLLRLSVPGN